jgi:hypothetical protein
MIFGGLAVILYAMGLSEAAVVPTIAAVAAAVVTVIKTGGSSSTQDDPGSDAGDRIPGPTAPGGALPPAPSRSTPDSDAAADAPAAADTEVPAR